ncbi:MAG: hypothetical protein FD147_2475 [Chloroflexi bacterium]|nr:MAG: hypothetical protein FD147_2475 [Chloroflexota bacterium]MBA4376750.1 hypothetical protein [Anaerolinea sp.]
MSDVKAKNIFLRWVGVALLQFIMAQVATFLVSLLVPGMENFPQTQPLVFVIVLGITFSAGIFLVGWLALKLRWLTDKPKYFTRLAATLIGAYIPLIVALFIYPTLEPGNPFFFISIWTCVLAFYVPEFVKIIFSTRGQSG